MEEDGELGESLSRKVDYQCGTDRRMTIRPARGAKPGKEK